MVNIDIQGALIPELSTFLVSGLTLVVMYLILKKYVFSIARNILVKRQSKMQEELENASILNKQAQDVLESAKLEITKASEKSNKIIENAKNLAQEKADEIISLANKNAENEVLNAQKEIEALKNQAKNELYDEIVSVSMETVNKILQDQASSQVDEELVSKYLKDN